MKKLKYYLIDVFTDKQFGGNQLAVFPKGQEVPEELMQKIAKELNFSETTFVLPPRNLKNNFGLRIFTPAAEIPMAGHPTIGSAFSLLIKNHLPYDTKSIVFEEGVGDILVEFIRENGKITTFMQQPLPIFGEEFDKYRIAEILSIQSDEIEDQYPVQVVSCGVPFLYIPVKSLRTIKKTKLRLDLYDKFLSDFTTNNLFVFTTETELANTTVHSRMFAPGLGVTEDPATGGASGPLGAYLVNYGIVEENKSIISEQGFEIGRPSIIHIDIKSSNKNISQVIVGGESVLSGEGFILVD